MNRDEILKMPAGREMDKLVAVKVIDSEWEKVLSACPNYSTDIAAAWEVVEEMRKKYTFAINDTGGQWRAMFVPDRTTSPFFSVVDNFNIPDLRWTAWEETAPLAICRAALLAVL